MQNQQVPVSPDEVCTTPARPKSKLLDPRSPAEALIRTPVLTPIKFDFSELEQALRNSSNKPLYQIPKDKVTKEISPSQLIFTTRPDSDRETFDSIADIVTQRTPLSTPTKVRGLSTTTPLAVRSPNIACPQPGVENLPVKGQLGFKETESTSIKVTLHGKANLRQMAHHQSHARVKGKGQRRPGGVQDENSARPIHL